MPDSTLGLGLRHLVATAALRYFNTPSSELGTVLRHPCRSNGRPATTAIPIPGTRRTHYNNTVLTSSNNNGYSPWFVVAWLRRDVDLVQLCFIACIAWEEKRDLAVWLAALEFFLFWLG